VTHPSTQQRQAVGELLLLQREQREAHLTGDADRLVDLFADDFVTVQDGSMTRPSRAKSRQRFQRYFDRVQFLAWEDLAPPVIEVADDASLATALVHKRVQLRYLDDAGLISEEEAVFAWHETWRRRDGGWELAVVVSTQAESTTTVAPAG
jgi:ketosteroid isomerase-like protein